MFVGDKGASTYHNINTAITQNNNTAAMHFVLRRMRCHDQGHNEHGGVVVFVVLAAVVPVVANTIAHV